jgi:transcription-repair coupling factor (superfamily II helicase)
VIYKRLAQAGGADDVDRLQSETEDRFGHLPAQAQSLFDMGRLRLLAQQAGVTGIDLIESKVQIRFAERPSVEPERILAVMAEQQGTLSPAGMVTLPAPDRGRDRIVAVTEVLRRMIGAGE